LSKEAGRYNIRINSIAPSAAQALDRVTPRSFGQAEARKVVRGLAQRFDPVKCRATEALRRPRVFCAEWLDPTFCTGHWLPEMVAAAPAPPAGPANQRRRLPESGCYRRIPVLPLISPLGR